MFPDFWCSLKAYQVPVLHTQYTVTETEVAAIIEMHTYHFL